MSNRKILVCALITMAFDIAGRAQPKRPITPHDCVTAKYFALDNSGQRAIQLSPDGARIAYLVKSPNLASNRNDIALYTADLRHWPAAKSRLLLKQDSLSEMQWLSDSAHLLLLARERGRKSVVSFDVRSGAVKILVRADRDIVEYSASADGGAIAFATESREAYREEAGKPTSNQIARGYRITMLGPQSLEPKRRCLFLTRKKGNGSWTAPKEISIESPLSHRRIREFSYIASLHLSLSPDGNVLLINYVDRAGSLPQAWRSDPFVKTLETSGFPVVLPTVAFDVRRGRTTMLLPSPWIADTPLWSPDGKGIALFAVSPVGGAWAKDDAREHRLSTEGAHLFSIDWPSGTIHEVAPRMVDISKQPLAWNHKGELIVHTSSRSITRYAERGGAWSVASSFELPLSDYYRFGELASNGIVAAGDYENAGTPPELFLFDSGSKKLVTLARLDPQFDHLTLAPARPVQWTTGTGYRVYGFLFLPPDYRLGRRYPLVIQTKPDEGQFVCDTGYNHYPSFAPQPIANAGMIYLAPTYREGFTDYEEQEHYPKGYPGGIGEAALQMDIWDSAVEHLAAQGLIDKNKVGIIGFSRSGWYTEFILTHSSVDYRAATLADNAQYDLLEYWLLRSSGIASSWNQMYGGPPYGKTLENWIKYSAQFHLDRIHAAVLMEVMGNGVSFDDARTMPLSLAAKMDTFTGLSYLNKPVELYYYPEERHQPDDPQARLASLQRNLDWYRFWLQGYERPNPEDPAQYLRWRKMREVMEVEPAQSPTANR